MDILINEDKECILTGDLNENLLRKMTEIAAILQHF